ncbi:PREDICTED: transport and Golgi organization protein 1 [Habropoda laboriosa]|uniref:transport and Golgi organization protein 1 n=1 Tax=Habropoda laboriosa TaxID=597456 RepID=UPI00083DCB04|nr:PREDICTED: transport and Golgi organization protein 1 [Habropoda laboriosa]
MNSGLCHYILVVMWNCSDRNMRGRNLFISILFIVVSIIFSAISQCSSTLSNKRLCYDPNCSEPVSLAKTIIKYNAIEPGLLSFDYNVDVKVYSKEAGERKDLWGVEINGKHGYAPKTFLKEYKILHRKLEYEVPTNPSRSNNVSSNEKTKSKKDNNKSMFSTKDIKASSTQIDNSDLKPTEEQSHNITGVTSFHEVIDGTTLHGNVNHDVKSSIKSTEVIQETVMPNIKDAVDDSKVSYTNGETESNIFTKDDTVLQKVLNDKVENEKQTISNKADIKDFVTSSEQILDLPELIGIHMLPLKTNSEETKLTAEKVKNNLPSDVKGDQSLEGVVDSNVPQEPILDVKHIENVDKIDTKTYAGSVIEPDVSSVKTPDKIETKGTESSENVTTDTSSVTKPDVLSVKIPEGIETKGTESSENITTDTDSVIKPDVPSVKTLDKVETKGTESLENVTTDTSSVIKPDVPSVKTLDKVETKGTESSENVTTDTYSVIKPDVPSVKAPEGIEITGTESSENVTTDTGGVIKPDVPSVKTLNKVETKGTESLENVTTDTSSVIKPDVPSVKTLDKVETKGTESLENVTTDTSSVIKPDVPSVKTLDKVETKGTESLENVTTDTSSVIKPDVPSVKTLDKVETKGTESSENVTTDTGGVIKPDVPSVKTLNKVETKGTESSENVTTDTYSVIKPDVPSMKAPEGIEITGTESSENVSTDTGSVNELDVKSVKAPEGIETNDTQYSESVVSSSSSTIPNVESAGDTPFSESSTQLEAEKDELNKEETESAAYLNKHNYDEYVSPLFLQLNVTDTVQVTLPSDNVVASAQNTEATSEFDTKNVQSDSNVMDIVSASQATLDGQLNSYIEGIESVVEAKSNVESNLHIEDSVPVTEVTSEHVFHQVQVSSPDFCTADNVECSLEDNIPHHEQSSQDSENALMQRIQLEGNYWLTLIYLSVTATATLIFCLGYYCIENMRRDRHLIARINKLEKDLLISEAECTMVNENLKSTKEKLIRMEDESFGSDEMVLSLRVDLEASQNAKTELEDQVAMLEKDLESATEAGLELERMLREVLSTNNEVNPLAQSVEDLQTRLNAQQAANESLTNALNFKTQENESLSIELGSVKKKYEELEVELTRITEMLKQEVNNKNNIEQTLTDRVQQLEMQLKEISTETANLQKVLKSKEVEAKDLVEVINRLNSNNLDLDKLYDVSHIKAEATELLEERNELKIKLAEVEGAHNLLEEHVKVIKEEIATLSEQCKAAEKEKKDAETRLEVLTNFFEEKEAQRQKEEAIWLQQQGEVVSTVERIQTMQNEIQNYKQQIEMLKREILDQEREYKNQFSLLETKAHEQWVIARQVERRLEESKVEAGQLRNRLTLIEKSINEVDSEAKLHRLEANGETTTSAPLFIGAESSNSPIMFSGSSSVPPPPPPSYLHSLFPPYLPPPLPNTSGVPPYEVSQRPPPLGGRLSSPPPMPLHPPTSNRYDNAGSPPPMSPRLLPPFNHRSPPPPPFGSDIHPPPPPPGSILPPPLGTPHSWGEESLPPPRNPGFHPTQRERVRNHKGSLHSSGESLNKSHHNSKV